LGTLAGARVAFTSRGSAGNTALMRMRHLRVRGFTAFALMLTFAGCTSTPRPSPTSSAPVPVSIQANGIVAPCLPGDVSLTTTAKPVAPPKTSGVVITTTLLNRRDFACALTTLICPHGDLYAEVVNAFGAIVWSPGYAVGCPPQPRLAADIVAPHTFVKVTEVWGITYCGPAYGCGPPTKAAPGMYRARGISDTVGVGSQSATFTVP